MTENIFSKIVAREIPADIVYEDEDVLAFKDVNPQAPVHVLVIPKREIATVNDLTSDDAELIGKLLLAARQVAQATGVAEDGYRVVVNCNAAAGQSVYYLHLHVLGGRPMSWPPG
jgi:histidine triad (HIT) family protein